MLCGCGSNILTVIIVAICKLRRALVPHMPAKPAPPGEQGQGWQMPALPQASQSFQAACPIQPQVRTLDEAILLHSVELGKIQDMCGIMKSSYIDNHQFLMLCETVRHKSLHTSAVLRKNPSYM